MSAVAEQTGIWLDRFTSQPAAPQPWLQALRERAFARFAELGFPNTHNEEWRFTNVAPIVRSTFTPATDRASVTVPENVKKLGNHAPVPWQGVDPAYLPVNIAYLDADFAVNQRATACHRSQFAPDELESDAAMLHLLWNGKISFRPFASLPSRSDDLFD